MKPSSLRHRVRRRLITQIGLKRKVLVAMVDRMVNRRRRQNIVELSCWLLFFLSRLLVRDGKMARWRMADDD